jgi:hypothetical protein
MMAINVRLHGRKSVERKPSMPYNVVAGAEGFRFPKVVLHGLMC